MNNPTERDEERIRQAFEAVEGRARDVPLQPVDFTTARGGEVGQLVDEQALARRRQAGEEDGPQRQQRLQLRVKGRRRRGEEVALSHARRLRL